MTLAIEWTHRHACWTAQTPVGALSVAWTSERVEGEIVHGYAVQVFNKRLKTLSTTKEAGQARAIRQARAMLTASLAMLPAEG